MPLVQTNLPMHYKRTLILLFAEGFEISSYFYKVPFTISISRALSDVSTALTRASPDDSSQAMGRQ